MTEMNFLYFFSLKVTAVPWPIDLNLFYILKIVYVPMDLTMYKMNDWQNYNDHGHDLVWIQDLSSAEVKS